MNMNDFIFGVLVQGSLLFLCILPILLFLQNRTTKKHTKLYYLGLWIFVFYLSGLMTATGLLDLFFRKPAFAPYFNFEFLVDIFSCPIQYLLNILLFVPLGFLAPLLWHTYRSEKRILLLGFSLSFLIEVLQMFCMRTTDIDDLLTNTLGALLGYWLLLAIQQKTIFHILRQRKKQQTPVMTATLFDTLFEQR